jgi:hypothetical protein
MRTLTAQEALILAMPDRSTAFRVRVDADGAGSLVDLTNLLGYDWVKTVDYDVNIDQPVQAATIVLHRQNELMSLATLMTGSLPNVTSGSYVPVLDIGRQLLVDICMSPAGQYATGTWQNVFDGRIDQIDWGKKNPEITLNCRDMGGLLVDSFIETVRPYGSTSGTAVETVMQSILTDNINTPGLGNVTLFSANGSEVTPWNPADSPGFMITPYSQQTQSVWDALLALAQLFGWDVRYKWHTATPAGFRLVMYDPGRSKVVPDYTFTSDNYYEPTRVSLNRADIRNAVRVRYIDSSTGNPTDVDVSNVASMIKFGRRWMMISRSSASLIRTGAEATALGNAALSDLATPVVDHQVDGPYFYAAELTDLYKWAANGVHYDTDQTAALFDVHHSLSRDKCRSSFGVRGVPSGGYRRWLGLAASVVDVGIRDGSIGATAPDLNTFRGENLLPNGDFGNVQTGGAAVPPTGWSLQPVVGSIVVLSQWGVDISEDVIFMANGARSIKISAQPQHFPSSPYGKWLFSTSLVPIATNDILVLDFAGASDSDLHLSSTRYLGMFASLCDGNKQYLSTAIDHTFKPATINQFFSTRKYARVTLDTARYATVGIYAMFDPAEGDYNAWIDNVIVKRVNQAGHFCFKTGDAAQSIAAGGTAIVWPTTQIDIGSALSSGYQYNAYQAGLYEFQASIALDGMAAGKVLSLTSDYNDVSNDYHKSIVTVAGTNAVQLVFSKQMNVGDYMYVFASHTDTVNRNTAIDDQLCYFIAKRIS